MLPSMVVVRLSQRSGVDPHGPSFHCLVRDGKLALRMYADVGKFSRFTSG